MSGEQGDRFLRDGLMHAMIVGPFYTKAAAVDVLCERNFKSIFQKCQKMFWVGGLKVGK